MRLRVCSNNKITFSGYELVKTPGNYTNRTALKLLEKELCEGMSKKEAADWMTKIKQTCKKFGIAPKCMPINSEHPGNLTGVERSNIFSEIFYSVFNETNGTKINLKF